MKQSRALVVFCAFALDVLAFWAMNPSPVCFLFSVYLWRTGALIKASDGRRPAAAAKRLPRRLLSRKTISTELHGDEN